MFHLRFLPKAFLGEKQATGASGEGCGGDGCSGASLAAGSPRERLKGGFEPSFS